MSRCLLSTMFALKNSTLYTRIFFCQNNLRKIRFMLKGIEWQKQNYFMLYNLIIFIRNTGKVYSTNDYTLLIIIVYRNTLVFWINNKLNFFVLANNLVLLRLFKKRHFSDSGPKFYIYVFNQWNICFLQRHHGNLGLF